MQWLTVAEIKEAAARGTREALDCAVKHWTQLVEASEQELRRSMASVVEVESGGPVLHEVSVFNTHCALCHRFNMTKGGAKGLACRRQEANDIVMWCPCCKIPDREGGCSVLGWTNAARAAYEWSCGTETHKNFVGYATMLRDALAKLKEGCLDRPD